MIRINLLQEKKKAARGERGQMTVLYAAIALAAAALGVFFFVHVPLQSKLDDVKAENDKRSKNIKQLQDATKEFDTVQTQLTAAKDQEDAIKRLNNARAVPSWMLFELSNVLTKDHKPTMSPEMAERIKNDANRQFSPGWDPKRIWVDSLDEKDGTLSISGGAQATTDVTQFALRLQASVFFTDVQPMTVTAAVDGASKLAYYKFTLTGKVLY
jgi:type IV pilus assembly protein PilN